MKKEIFDNLYEEVKEMLNSARQQSANGFHTEGLFLYDMAFDGIEYTKHIIPKSEAFLTASINCLEEIRDRLITETENRLYTN